jgi:uncharacterized protein (DUF433 family)
MATGYANIELRDGEAFIAGTQIKVRMLIRHHLGYGRGGEELQRNFPFLTLGQVYSALAYYHEHKDEIDRQIEERAREARNYWPEYPILRCRHRCGRRGMIRDRRALHGPARSRHDYARPPTAWRRSPHAGR